MNMSSDFYNLKEIVLEILGSDSHVILSTNLDGKVSSRLIDFVRIDLRLGFFTWKNSRKIRHLRQNPAVALCLENLQIEGTASIHETTVSCRDFIETYKKQLPDIYSKFSRLEDICFVTVEPDLYIVMKYEQEALYLDHLDLKRSTAYRKKLSDWK